MRSKLLGLLLGCGLAVAGMAPAFSCQFHTATADQTPSQQTAQAQSSQTGSQ
jgi:hypothetical protein